MSASADFGVRSRRGPVAALLVGLGSMFLLNGPVASADPVDVAMSVVDRVRSRVYPALVNVSVVHERYGEGRTHRYPGAGSGVVLTPEGHVLTNYHVAGGARRVECTLTDGRVFDATIVLDDPLTDLTVLKLELGTEAGEPLPWAELARDDDVEVGDAVFAMGNPLALSSSMTRGIVSNAARVFTDFTGTEIEEMTLEADQLSGLLTRWIQHDALILPGNSGGPLVDTEGRVVGINELGGRGIGFAIPASIARTVLEAALEPEGLRRGWLGFSVLPVEKLGRREGALISSVLPGSAAETAGLLPGDRLLAIDGDAVTAVFFEEVPLVYQRVARIAPGRDVILSVERSGERLDLEAPVEAMPKFKGEEWEIDQLGATVQEITPPMAISRRFPDREGLLLTSLRPGSPADGARPRLAPFDVLLTLDGKVVEGPEGIVRHFDGMEPGTKGLLEIRRGEERLLVLVPAPGPGRRAWGGELPKPWLGIETQVLGPELSKHLGLAGRTGFRITQVLPWTEAESAGLQVGDVVVAIDGEPTEPTRAQESEDLRRRIEERYIDDVVELSILRSGDPRAVPVRLEARPRDADDAETYEQRDLEFEVRDVTLLDRIQNGWDRDQTGVLVVDAVSGGWAQMAGLRLQDLILSVNGRRVEDVTAFSGLSAELREARAPRIVLFVRRGYRTHFVFVEPDWDELPGREGRSDSM